jgi:hypothetical protein
VYKLDVLQNSTREIDYNLVALGEANYGNKCTISLLGCFLIKGNSTKNIFLYHSIVERRYHYFIFRRSLVDEDIACN